MTMPVAATTDGQVSAVTPMATMTAARINETSNPSCSCFAGGGPMIRAGMVSTGRIRSTAVPSRFVAVSPDATAPAGCPDWMRTLAWTTPPVAAPPGTTLLAALPASWAAAAVPQPNRGGA